jgi:hypothetical protein
MRGGFTQEIKPVAVGHLNVKKQQVGVIVKFVCVNVVKRVATTCNIETAECGDVSGQLVNARLLIVYDINIESFALLMIRNYNYTVSVLSQWCLFGHLLQNGQLCGR